MQSTFQNNYWVFEGVELTDLPALAAHILKHAQHPVNLLEAPMGSGKTTLCNELLRQWGSEDAGSSPTFALIEEHHGPEGRFYHLDAYRLESEEQAYDVGLEEYLEDGCPMWIEWGEKVRSLLPYKLGVVYLKAVSLTQRRVEFHPSVHVNEIQWNHE
ncbi:MAG: tRNA ((37)-N6)-threonylcarbamoyltransferase complex ATPase subunit type 1 TsaE [Bacteroidota bacterium]|jgi:tRNA threonylcarbamoyladenosine biosynthesis protein TsaE